MVRVDSAHQYHKILRPKDKKFGVTTFRHEDIGLKGVNGKPYVALDELLPDSVFEELDYEIGIGIACNKTGIQGGSVRGQIPPALRSHYHGDLESEVFNQIDKFDPDGRHRRALEKMDRYERQKYCYMVMGGLPVWHQLIYIRNIDPTPGYEDIKPYWTEEAKRLFPKTIEFAKKLPFAILGRVLIFCTYPHYPIPAHRDWIQAPHRDHHINVSSKKGRPIYVYDELKNQKYFLPKDVRTYFFNLRDYHGVDAVPFYTYTLKFEGIFNESFQRKLGLEDGYVWK